MVNSSTAARLLERLDLVRSTGPGRWLARCPSHDDGSPSLSIRELGDGRLLLHDFGGCDVDDVVAAVGLEISNLFPPRLPTGVYSRPRERHPFPASDILKALLLLVRHHDRAGRAGREVLAG